MIPVTKSFLPNRDSFNKYVDDIWSRGWLTNNGPIVIELEERVKSYLESPPMLYLTNGTIAIQLALRALDIKGDVLTTPFSYVATTSCLVWENCNPVFCDIDASSLTVTIDGLEKNLTDRTSAILLTHIYGQPCDVDAIEQFARAHNLKVIYDGAHSFGVKMNGRSIFHYGDISTCSFHATKIFHTVEGGAVFSNNENVYHKLSYMRNFGHRGQEEFWGIGINGKSSEFHAAMGLCVLENMENIIQARKTVHQKYDEKLSKLFESVLRKPKVSYLYEYNYAYYPVIFDSKERTEKAIKLLNANQIFPRRYFYPSLNTLPYLQYQKMPISESIAERIICLPLYTELTDSEIDRISSLLKESLLY
jgi:dTDP-4-amino-4,6-dideoxygalactose transaminase